VGEFLRMRVLSVRMFHAERERIEQAAGDLAYLGESFRCLVSGAFYDCLSNSFDVIVVAQWFQQTFEAFFSNGVFQIIADRGGCWLRKLAELEEFLFDPDIGASAGKFVALSSMTVKDCSNFVSSFSTLLHCRHCRVQYF